MGAFFSNVQLKTSGIDKSNLIEQVIEYLVGVNGENGFSQVQDDAEADKTIILSLSDDLNWISIYDEETEEQDIEKLNKLSSGLSKHFKTTALEVLVNDSDSVHVGINVNGTLGDVINNFEGNSEFDAKRPEIWSDIFVNEYSFEDLALAWTNRSLFVESFLTQLATYTNLELSKLLTGFRYWNAETPNEGIKLHFVAKNKNKPKELGLTKLARIAREGYININSADKQSISWLITNHGKSSTGLEIIIAGECIQYEGVKAESANIRYHRYITDKQNEFTFPFSETVALTGEKLFYLRIDDIEIPEGIEPVYPMSPKEGERCRDILYNAAIKINISFIGKESAKGTAVDIFFSPLINKEYGTYYELLVNGGIGPFKN